MANDAHDIQVCLWKILKLLSSTCVTYSLKHPFVSSLILCLFLLYMAFPFVFWLFVYSVPVIVICTIIVLSIYFNVRRRTEEAEDENDGKYTSRTSAASDNSNNKDIKGKKPFSRVHSVRRRRAKAFTMDDKNNNNNNHSNNISNNDTNQKVDDKNAVSSTSFSYDDMVDKNALTAEENSPKEIREVEVDYSLVSSTKSHSCSASQCSKQEFEGSSYQSFSDGNENIKAMRGNGLEDDDEEYDRQKNKMDIIGISDSERNKRLESLIARRRSRKLLSLEVRRTLMDRNERGIPSIVIPKNNNASRILIPSSSSSGGLISPSPGSAPSVLIPMRNPFDLPYDPQEEKPDLTGDSFDQEFKSGNNNRDMMFCRHESFSLGPFLPGEYNSNRREASSIPVSRFRQRASSIGYKFSKPAGKEIDRDFGPIVEHKSLEPSESKPTIASPNNDHIKEIIQVHENGSEEGDIDEVQTRKEDSSRSPTSSDEDVPVFKIDREAILKSLSSMARRNIETDNYNNDQIGDHLSNYSTSPNRLRDRFYYPDRTTRRHTASYSIASDLQVEFSEFSSPPLTIDENLSYRDDEDNNSTCDVESWAGSSQLDLSSSQLDLSSSQLDLSHVDEYESRSAQVDEVSKRDVSKVGFSRSDESVDSNEKQCVHPWCAIAEFPDTCQTRSTILEDKIDKTFQRSASLVSQTSNPNDSKPPECSHALNKSEELNTTDTVNGSKIIDSNTNIIEETATNESSEHLAAESINSAEDSEETLGPEHQELIMEAAIVEDHVNYEPIQYNEGDQQDFSEASITRASLGSDAHEPAPSNNNLMPNVAFEFAQSSSLSPKSVLLPSCSLASFDQYLDDEVNNAHLSTPVAHQNATAFMDHSAPPPDFYRGEVEVFEESAEPSGRSNTEADDAESPKQHNVRENEVKLDEAACGSSRTLSSHEAPAKPTDGTRPDRSNGSDSPLSTEEQESAETLRTSITEANDAEFYTKQHGIRENDVKLEEAVCSSSQIAIHEAPAEPTEEPRPNQYDGSKYPLSTEEHESPEPSRTSITEADDAELSTKQHKICGNDVKLEEAACSSSQIPSSHEPPTEPTDEIRPHHSGGSNSPLSTKEELPEPSRTSVTEADDTDFPTKQHEIPENDVKLEEAACSSSQIPSSHEAPVEPTDETRPHHSDCSNSLVSTEEELSKRGEIFTGETIQDDNTKSTGYEIRTETSSSHKDNEHKHNLNDPKDQEIQANATSSNCFNDTKHEAPNSAAHGAPTELSDPMEDNNINSVSYEKHKED